MPRVSEMKEARAAFVLRQFLTPRQVDDFDRKRAFVAVGCDTGNLYRLTSRWSDDVERYGVLQDTTMGETICASNKLLPPAEELLSLKLCVEHLETRFLDSWGFPEFAGIVG